MLRRNSVASQQFCATDDNQEKSASVGSTEAARYRVQSHFLGVSTDCIRVPIRDVLVVHGRMVNTMRRSMPMYYAIGAIAVVAALGFLTMLPDLRRYMKMRSM
jgi:hypothetical protein